MKCQVPGCKNKATKLSKKNVLNCGVYLENTIIRHCGRHSEEDLDKIYDSFVADSQMVNPMLDVQKIKKPKKDTSKGLDNGPKP